MINWITTPKQLCFPQKAFYISPQEVKNAKDRELFGEYIVKHAFQTPEKINLLNTVEGDLNRKCFDLICLVFLEEYFFAV